MICYPGKQQLWQESVRWSTGIERQTYLTPTSSPLPTVSLPIPASALPLQHPGQHTCTHTHLRLAEYKLGISQANVLFHSSHSHLLLSPFLPHTHCHLCSPFSLRCSPSVSLFLYPLALEARKTSNGTFGQPPSSWQLLK